MTGGLFTGSFALFDLDDWILLHCIGLKDLLDRTNQETLVPLRSPAFQAKLVPLLQKEGLEHVLCGWKPLLLDSCALGIMEITSVERFSTVIAGISTV